MSSDDEVFAVLAHEVGHVLHRHGQHRLVQQQLGTLLVMRMRARTPSNTDAEIPMHHACSPGRRSTPRTSTPVCRSKHSVSAETVMAGRSLSAKKWQVFLHSKRKVKPFQLRSFCCLAHNESCFPFIPKTRTISFYPTVVLAC